MSQAIFEKKVNEAKQKALVQKLEKVA